MAASDHLHPEQLKMFATGEEIKGMVTDSGDRKSVAGGWESMDQMWSRKETESRKPKDTGHGAGVYDSLKEKGYVVHDDYDKVGLSHNGRGKTLGDGHHRVAAADALTKEGQQTWVPLRHTDPFQQRKQDAYFGPRKPQRKPNPALDAAIQGIVKHFQ